MKLNLPSESLLSVPDKNVSAEKIVRPSGPPVQVAEEFLNVSNRSKDVDAATASTRLFSRQYAHAYAVRLWGTRPLLESEVKKEWEPEGVVVKKIADLCQSSSGSHPAPQPSNSKENGSRNSPMKKSRQSDDHEQHIAMREDIVVVIVGTVFKQQPEKPSILQELVEDNPMIPFKPKTRYISDKDIVLLEDETARVQLVPTKGCGMSVEGIVNGIIIAVKGKPTINGKFEVDDVIYATPKPSNWPEIKACDAEMVFVSGLQLANNRKSMARLDLLFDYLQGLTGCPDEHESSLKMKTRLFIVGNSFGKIETDDTKKEKEDAADKTEIAKRLDDILDQLSQTMEVFIIPGENDPSEPMFPQAPIHRCLLPLASKRCSFHSLSNPTRLEIPLEPSDKKSSKSKQSLDMILTGGQSVKDAMRNSNIDNPVEMSQKLLQWGHLCPTAPDTMALHPGLKEDIFVLNSLPNLFVVGNQKQFATREWKNCRIVTVPKFSDTGVAVILDRQLNIIPLNIKLSD